MSKSRKQQQNSEANQQQIFDYFNEPVTIRTGGTGKGSKQGVELLSQLEKNRILTEHLLEAVVDYGNLRKAYQRVYENGGKGGVDGMNLEEFGKWFASNYKLLPQAILEESYRPDVVKKVFIPKATGGKRMLGIPTLKDRLIQQAIHQQLIRYYDPLFSESSFGFRPGRSAQQAITQASRYVASGKEWVVDIDLEKFFDKVNHDRLMQRLSKGIGDKRLLRLIKSYLTAGIMSNGLVEQRISGTPQGSPLSPLLSNIVLDELDKELEKRGHSFCRYADDCNIYVKSERAGQRIMASLIIFIEQKLKLKVNRKKSGVRHCSKVKYLGYTILPGGGIRVSDSSINRLKDKIRSTTKRNRGVKFSQVIEELNTQLRGWANYFRLADSWLSAFRSIDSWIRRKLRCYRLKQLGRKYTIFKFLRNLGIAENRSWGVVMYSGSWWNMSNRKAVNEAMGLRWFAQNGLQPISIQMIR